MQFSFNINVGFQPSSTNQNHDSNTNHQNNQNLPVPVQHYNNSSNEGNGNPSELNAIVVTNGSGDAYSNKPIPQVEEDEDTSLEVLYARENLFNKQDSSELIGDVSSISAIADSSSSTPQRASNSVPQSTCIAVLSGGIIQLTISDSTLTLSGTNQLFQILGSNNRFQISGSMNAIRLTGSDNVIRIPRGNHTNLIMTNGERNLVMEEYTPSLTSPPASNSGQNSLAPTSPLQSQPSRHTPTHHHSSQSPSASFSSQTPSVTPAIRSPEPDSQEVTPSVSSSIADEENNKTKSQKVTKKRTTKTSVKESHNTPARKQIKLANGDPHPTLNGDFNEGTDVKGDEDLDEDDDDDVKILSQPDSQQPTRPVETVSRRREIVNEQNRAYEESLLADQAKQEKKRLEEEKRLMKEQKKELQKQLILKAKEEAKNKLPSEPNGVVCGKDPESSENVVVLHFRLPSGASVQRNFRPSDTLSIVFQYIYSNSETPEKFDVLRRPNQVFGLGCLELEKTLRELGFQMKELLVVREIITDDEEDDEDAEGDENQEPGQVSNPNQAGLEA